MSKRKKTKGGKKRLSIPKKSSKLGVRWRYAFLSGVVVALIILSISYSQSELGGSSSPHGMIRVESKDQLYSAMNYSGPILVAFTGVNCPTCKYLRPYLEKYAEINHSVRVVDVVLEPLYSSDPSLTNELMQYYKIQGTPTLVLIYRGEVYGYHEGIWGGFGVDQLPYIESFVETSLGNKPLFKALELRGSLGENNNQVKSILAASGDILSTLFALGMGVLAAVSPCSLPMLTLYAVSSGKRVLSKTLYDLAILTLVVAGFGVLLAKIYSLSSFIERFVMGFAAGFSLFLGYELLSGRIVILSRAATIFAPLAGLECSLPFFVGVLSIVSLGSMILAVLGSVAFGIGYSVVYIVASETVSRILSFSGDKYNKLSGSILIVLGIGIVVYSLTI